MKKTNYVECKSVDAYLPEAEAKEVDELCKTLPEDCRKIVTKSYEADIQFEPNERAEVSIISTEAVDSHNEVIILKGVNLDPFRRNSVVLWNHNRNKLAGTCKWI